MLTRNFPGRASTVALCIAASWLTANSSSGNDWLTFRGTGRTAVSQDTGLLQEWSQGGPPLAWETQGAGRGYASLAVAGDRIYTLGDGPSTADDKDEYLLCFERATGKQIWKAKTGPAWNTGDSNWQGSRSTPSVDGDRVYVITPHGELVCCDSASGAERWRKSLPKDLSGNKGDKWGYSESVLIDGEMLICTPGGEKTTMVALDKFTGAVKWQCGRDGEKGAGHASIAISEVGGTRIYVQVTAGGPLGVRAADGKLLWSYPIEKTTCVIPTPIVRDDLVFFSVGYKRGGALLRQVPGQEGEITIAEVYPLKIELSNKHGGVVLVGNYVYGDSDDGGIPFCADLMTGAIKWKHRGPGNGSTSVIAADNRIYLRFANGIMAVAKSDPADYAEMGSFKIPGSGERPSWSHPVIVDGRLYLREQDRLLCYDIRAK